MQIFFAPSQRYISCQEVQHQCLTYTAQHLQESPGEIWIRLCPQCMA